MHVIYLDSLFLLNLLADYLLCLSAGRLCGLRLRRGRYFSAALLGAAYAAAVYLPGLGFLALPAGRLGCGLCMGLLAFGQERQPLRCTGVLLLVGAAFGGALWAVSLAGGGGAGGAVSLSLPLLGSSFALCYALLSLLLRARRLLTDRRRVAVKLNLLGREADFFALEDTGNTLSDPLTGRHVLIACPHALRPLFRENTVLFEELPPVELLEALAAIPELAARFRLLPCAHIGGGALLPVFRPERTELDGRATEDLLVAVSPHASGDGFEAIL